MNMVEEICERKRGRKKKVEGDYIVRSAERIRLPRKFTLSDTGNHTFTRVIPGEDSLANTSVHSVVRNEFAA